MPDSSARPSDRVPAICLAVFAIAWTGLAIAPRYRADWLLENLPTFLLLPIVILTYRRFRLSDQAYIQATLFALLHTVGSHYTYSEVPIGAWLRDFLELSRNHYDRVVHFAFGLLMLRPLREIVVRHPKVVGRVPTAIVGFAAVACWSVFYEIVEWIVASLADPAAGTAYLGTQGDEWDAQKDMAAACVGAIVATLFDWRSLTREAQRRQRVPAAASKSGGRNRRQVP